VVESALGSLERAWGAAAVWPGQEKDLRVIKVGRGGGGRAHAAQRTLQPPRGTAAAPAGSRALPWAAGSTAVNPSSLSHAPQVPAGVTPVLCEDGPNPKDDNSAVTVLYQARPGGARWLTNERRRRSGLSATRGRVSGWHACRPSPDNARLLLAPPATRPPGRPRRAALQRAGVAAGAARQARRLQRPADAGAAGVRGAPRGAARPRALLSRPRRARPLHAIPSCSLPH
jgi:hypothetical protein